MADDIGVGDILERLKPCFEWGGFVVGALYTVRQIVHWPRGCRACHGDIGVLLCEAPDPPDVIAFSPPNGAWCICGFRPISRRADFARTLEALKQPSPARVLEPAGADAP